MKHCIKGLSIIIFGIMCLAYAVKAHSTIRGVCSNCHTMHNSQDALPMAIYGTSVTGSTGPNEFLTRGTCVGCHAQGGPMAVAEIGPDKIPQVYHVDAQDLAGGNFAYITGAKGDGASDYKGHNVAGLTNIDSILHATPPGGTDGLTFDKLTCAGASGCHGARHFGTPQDPMLAIEGAHHGNVDGKLDNPTDTATSYRFLLGVKGLESPTWRNDSAASHNEYFGRTTPIKLGCSTGETMCHTSLGTAPPDGTMSQFCATCHGNFHTLTSSSTSGIGSDAISPFVRHPTDLALPADAGKEYAAYTTYNVEAPVARTGVVPDTPSATVSPGTDAVMCLSCHYAHASNYPDMLRWDYTKMVAQNTDPAYVGTGCFVCHTTKDD